MTAQESKKLFSVVVLCYRHFELLPDALDSVLSQDYPRIELIVSDDGSDVFPEANIRDYLEKRRTEHIAGITINHEQKNGGTVHHLNQAQKLTHGDYIVFLAADDALYDSGVLSRYAEGFEKNGTDCLIEMAQTAMCDYTLGTVNGYYLQKHVRELLENGMQGTKAEIGGDPEARTAEYYEKRPCPGIVYEAARILAEMLGEEEEKERA